MTKILVIKPHPQWAYNAGEVGVVPTDKAQVMITAGFWQKVEDDKQPKTNNTTKRKRSNAGRGERASKD